MSVKRKANDRGCDCSPHDSIIECKQAAQLKQHVDVLSDIVMYSRCVTVYVGGKEKTAFSIHENLITFHSRYFSNRLRDISEDDKIFLPQLKPEHFKEFISWMYTRQLSNTPLDSSFRVLWYIELWMMGRFLIAPEFQNCCMDIIRAKTKIEVEYTLDIPEVTAVYNTTTKGSMPRKFTADLMNWKNPFRNLEEGSEPWARWEALLQKYPDLSNDMAKSAWKNWNNSHPWDDDHRELYMVDESSLATE